MFFYYSGHGERHNDDFQFMFKDYSGDMMSCLLDSLLDNMVRDISPDLYVKIVDSCYSEVKQIKSEDGENSYDGIVKRRNSGSGTGLNDVFFMYSSRSNEASVIHSGSNFSCFTEQIIEFSMSTEDGEDISFNDIETYIVDAYRTGRMQQTPRFVKQSSGVDIFFTSSSDLILDLTGIYRESFNKDGELDKGKESSNSEEVKIEFLEKEDIEVSIHKGITSIGFSEESNSIYNISISSGRISDKASYLRSGMDQLKKTIESIRDICKRDFFVRFEDDEIEVEDQNKYLIPGFQVNKRIVKVIKSMRSTFDLDCESIMINAAAKDDRRYLRVQKYTSFMIFSRSSFMLIGFENEEDQIDIERSETLDMKRIFFCRKLMSRNAIITSIQEFMEVVDSHIIHNMEEEMNILDKLQN